jgi:hypothetical protein
MAVRRYPLEGGVFYIAVCDEFVFLGATLEDTALVEPFLQTIPYVNVMRATAS